MSDNEFVHTMEDAKAKKLWPRAEPLQVRFTANPTTIQRGDSSELTISVQGGTPPFDYVSNESQLSLEQTERRSQQLRVRPSDSTAYSVTVNDSKGQSQHQIASVTIREITGEIQPPLPPARVAEPQLPSEVTAEGPLAEALIDLWTKARRAKFPNVARLTVRLFDAAAAWKVHTAAATLGSEAEVHCTIDAAIEAEGIEKFEVSFAGRMEKASAVRSFLDPQIRASNASEITVTYALTFSQPLSLGNDAAEQFGRKLTQYGAGQGYVEAQAGRAAVGG
jgi:hypothetical protein